MIKENELLYEFIQNEKKLCVEKQNYEGAALLHDKARNLKSAKTKVVLYLNKNEDMRYRLLLAEKRNEKINQILK